MQFEFDGIDQLIKELEHIEEVTEDLKDEALIEGGDYLRDRMKDEVYSHGLIKRTGEAEESIVRTDPKNNELFVGTQGGRRQQGFYLYMHEFGYYNVRAGRFIGPKPFASIVYENSKNQILNKYVQVFRRGLGMK